MSVMSPELLVVPALSSDTASLGFTEVRQELIAEGVRPALMSVEEGIRGLPQVALATRPFQRARIKESAESMRPVLERVGGLLVVNDMREAVRTSGAEDAERICGIPNSVGYLAASLIGVANEVYGGPGNGRVFLSHGYPDGSELFSAASDRRAVTLARVRFTGLYPLRPKALQGNLRPAITAAKTPKPPRA